MPHVSKGDIHAYLDGELNRYPEEDGERIRAHLEGCGTCAASVEEERQLRLVASQILSTTADAPLDLVPFEELVARAGKPESTVAESVGSRMKVLRMAATVVISLGAGWIARDLQSPTNRPATTLPEVTSAVSRSASDRRENQPSDGRQEDESDLSAQAAAPAVATVAEQEVVPTAAQAAVEAQAAIAEPLVAPTNAPLVAEAKVRDEVQVGRRDERARVALARGLADTSSEEQILQSDLDVSFADGAGAAALEGTSAAAGSFVVPNLSVLDVRLRSRGSDSGPTLVVVQEFPNGDPIELWYTVADSDPTGLASPSPLRAERAEARETVQQVPQDATAVMPEGWHQVTRVVPGGVLTIRGPLSASELSELLDRVLIGR